MEKEWEALTTEEYILVKHCNFTRADVAEMTAEERKVYIKLLRKEREEENKQAKAAQRPAGGSGSSLPSR